VADHPGHAALDGTVPEFYRRRGLGVLGAAGRTPTATQDSIFLDTYVPLDAPDELLAKWARIRAIRDAVNKEIETVRAPRPGGLVAASQREPHREPRVTTPCWPAWAMT
jgi:hypothetical protein